MFLSVSISTRPCLSPRASACASPICAQAAVFLRPAPAYQSYFGFRLKSPTARRRRFLRPPARTTRHTRQALGAPGLLLGIPNLGLAPAGGRMGGAGATPPARLQVPQWPAPALTLSGAWLCVNCRFGNGWRRHRQAMRQQRADVTPRERQLTRGGDGFQAPPAGGAPGH